MQNPHPFRISLDEKTYSGCWQVTHGMVHVTSAFGSETAPAGEDPQRTAQALLVRIVERLCEDLRRRPGRRNDGAPGDEAPRRPGARA
jgi:hypothetical protein